MTISSSVSKATLNGDGVQTEFPFAFKVWKAGDLEVSITSPLGANTLVTDWTVELAGIGGTVTYPTTGYPLPTGWKITLRRFMDFLQDVDLVSGTRFDPEVIETALDIAAAERQQLLEEISRAVRVGVASGEDPADVINQVFEARDAAEASVDDAAAQVVLCQGQVQLAVNQVSLAEGWADAAAASAIEAQAAQLAAEAISTEAAARAYNYIINGNFDIWQRGTSQTTSEYGSDDRWSNENVGTTKTNLRASFAVGEAFPDGVICPSYYSGTNVSSVVGAGNYARKLHKIESVRALAGKNVLISFYARADAARNVSIELTQNFGSGGTPSVPIGGIGVQKISLSTTWQRYSITKAVPSITGKVLGSNNNDFLSLSFWFDAGSSFNTRTSSLGHQSGTFDIAAVSLVEGDVDVKPIPRSIGEELALCQRYYESASLYTWAVSSAASNIAVINWLFKVSKRVPPVLTQGFITNPSGLVYNSTPHNSADGCAFAYSTVMEPGGVAISASADSEL